MDSARAAKLALARKKLKDHQDKKTVTLQKEEHLINFPKERTNTLSNPTPVEDVIEINHNFDINKIYNIDQEIHTLNNYKEPSLHVSEILILEKQHIEKQLKELESKLSITENNETITNNENCMLKQFISRLETDLKETQLKFSVTKEELIKKNIEIEHINKSKASLYDENNNLLEQLDFTKTALTSKEFENSSLQINNLQSKLEAAELHLQQLTNGSLVNLSQSNANTDSQEKEALQQKVNYLEHQVKTLKKERDQVSTHYEHYVSELNVQINSISSRNNELMNEVNNLSVRERSLIEQIADMEIRLQNYKKNQEPMKIDSNNCYNDIRIEELRQENTHNQEKIEKLTKEYADLLLKLSESETKIRELTEAKDTEYNLSVSKLSADIASDKIAAQKATEQNKKLKSDLQNLEVDFIKMSKDKLDLTEMLTNEKHLNRELTLKLADCEDKAKELFIKLKAKDEEMIRLQTNNRDIEIKMEKLLSEEATVMNNDNAEAPLTCEHNGVHHHDETSEENALIDAHIENDTSVCNHVQNNTNIPIDNAMVKLQDRFLKIMGEVADLSDEKHRLEHIILQLQNETDTICEYVALYQQQRSLLKKRDEERSAQINMFQTECDRLKRQVEELSGILKRFSEDTHLTAYFQDETKRNDLQKAIALLSNLRDNSLVDPQKICTDFKDFYPCSCCSGKLIDV